MSFYGMLKKKTSLRGNPIKTGDMKKISMITLTFLLTGQLFAQGSLGEVIGTVVDKKTNVPVYNAAVYIQDQGHLYQARTEYDGRFRISAIPAGTYVMNIRQYEDTMKNLIVQVPMDGFYNAGTIEFTSSIVTKGPVTASAGLNDVKLIDGNLPVLSITALEIEKSSSKNDIKGMLTMMSSEIRQTDDGDLVFRGARKGDMLYLMDGVKTASIGTVPSSSIGRMMVYTGGLPAKYGDTMGGVVVMESKSYFDLYRQWEAEEIKAGRR